jgi:hypothetical protein
LEVFRTSPQRAYDLTWIAPSRSILWARPSPPSAKGTRARGIAWALLRIWQRLRAAGGRENGTVPLPFRSRTSRCAGLSLVHTNKTLARFRQRQLCDWSDGILRILDLQAPRGAGLVDSEPPERRPLM